MPKIAVLTFPGNNCETETVRALQNAGFQSEVFLWNRTKDELLEFDGVVIPGGFSFEDRGRSGIVSSQEPIFKTLKIMAEKNIPILGICNGAQMLVESGLILADSNNIPACALLWNKRVDNSGTILGTGFYHSWKNIKPVNIRTPFSNFKQTIHIPIAHGEGRFTFTEEMEKEIIEKNLIIFQYVDDEGNIDDHYPINPNGSFKNIAGLSNPTGNVVALMPHPERADEGNAVFESLWNYFKTPWELNNEKITLTDFLSVERKKTDEAEITVLVRLKITDKTEKTFANVLEEENITRREKWGFYMKNNISSEEKITLLSSIISAGELVNENKQWVVAKIDGEWYDWNEGVGFEKNKPRFEEKNCFIVEEKEDFKGIAKHQHLSHIFPNNNIEKISYGVCWEVPENKKEEYVSHSLFSTRVGDFIKDLV